MKVFLGGTVNGSTWRDYMMPKLQVEFFNPVVEEWNDEAYEKEIYEKRHSDYCLYVITPKFTGYFAIAEVTDDSYNKPDRTIFCYLTEDTGVEFTPSETQSLERLGKRVQENGGIWLKTLDEIIEFLNQGAEQKLQTSSEEINDVFICYGRKNSKAFASNLRDQLTKNELKVWIDLNEIPIGLGFRDQLNDAITHSNNFIFIVSPHSLRSEYCLRELEYAAKYNKRIIPIYHNDLKEDWDKLPELIEKSNLAYISDKSPGGFDEFISSVSMEKEYIEKHTNLLLQAIKWQDNEESKSLLLFNKERIEANNWLNTKFESKSAPCKPSILHIDYIYTSNQLNFSSRLAEQLAKSFKFITHHKKFETTVNVVALANPVSMVPQLYLLIAAILAGQTLAGISVGMFVIFLIINCCFALVWIKQKNVAMFFSTFLSIIINISIIITGYIVSS